MSAAADNQQPEEVPWHGLAGTASWASGTFLRDWSNLLLRQDQRILQSLQNIRAYETVDLSASAHDAQSDLIGSWSRS